MPEEDDSKKPAMGIQASIMQFLHAAKAKFISIYNKILHRKPQLAPTYPEDGQEPMPIEEEEPEQEEEYVEVLKLGLRIPKSLAADHPKKIAIDMDGTFLDTYFYFYSLVGKDRGWKVVSRDMIKSQILQKNAKLTQEEIDYYLARVYESDDLKLIDPSVPAIIHDLRNDLGYKIEIITASIASEETIGNVLTKRGIEFDGIVKVKPGEDKSIYTEARILIDDSVPRAVDFARKEGYVGIVPLMPWNTRSIERLSKKMMETGEHLPNLYILENWKEIESLLLALARNSHDSRRRENKAPVAKVKAN